MRKVFIKTFQPQFVPAIEAGLKTQTVRPKPSRMPVPGDRISLRTWTGRPYRTKQRTIRDSVITRVRNVVLWREDEVLSVDGIQLAGEELQAFAQADGFKDAAEMFAWFREQYPPTMSTDQWLGILVEWAKVENA